MSSSDSEDEKAKAKPATRATDAEGENIELDYDKKTGKGEICVKVICLGDSAVGKSKWVAVLLLDALFGGSSGFCQEISHQYIKIFLE